MISTLCAHHDARSCRPPPRARSEALSAAVVRPRATAADGSACRDTEQCRRAGDLVRHRGHRAVLRRDERQALGAEVARVREVAAVLHRLGEGPVVRPSISPSARLSGSGPLVVAAAVEVRLRVVGVEELRVRLGRDALEVVAGSRFAETGKSSFTVGPKTRTPVGTARSKRWKSAVRTDFWPAYVPSGVRPTVVRYSRSLAEVGAAGLATVATSAPHAATRERERKGSPPVTQCPPQHWWGCSISLGRSTPPAAGSTSRTSLPAW